MVRISFALSAAMLLSLTFAPAGYAQGQAAGPGPSSQQSQDTTPTDELRGLDLTGRDQVQSLESPFASQGNMTADRLGDIVRIVDPNAEELGNGFAFSVEERALRLVYDERADRMRIVTPIISSANLPEEVLMRMLQANFDSALDVRYAVGGGNVWSVFIHRMSSLKAEDLISGIAQTAIAAETFGTSFSSGAVVFGGGDSQELNRRLQEQLEEALRNGDARGI